MHYKRFVLSFTATALLLAPFAINANGPNTGDDVVVAPAPGNTMVVDGVTFDAAVVKHDTKVALIRIKARNETGERISTEVVASLMQEPVSSPMARMVPMPRELSADAMELDLAPGETLTRTFRVKLPEDVTEQLVAAEAARKELIDSLTAQAPNASDAPAQQVNADVVAANLATLAPAFYAQVHTPPPATATPAFGS